MNIIFFGSSHFAAPSLEALFQAGQGVVSVITQPDKKSGRGMHLGHTVIKTIAENFNCKIYQPQDINSPEAISFLKAQNCDLFVVVAYGQILSQELLEIPKIFAVNLHASLLPEYRGAAPINWAIINGDKATGISVIKMNRKMDAGEIIAQEKMDILETDTASSLENKLADLAAKILITSLEPIKKQTVKLMAQNNKQVTFAPKLRKSDGKIDWEKSTGEICNLVRGSLNWPGAFTYYRGRLLKIYKANRYPQELERIKYAPGEVAHIFKDSIVVATGKGGLLIEELQPEGKRRMQVQEFLSGHEISLGETFGKK